MDGLMDHENLLDNIDHAEAEQIVFHVVGNVLSIFDKAIRFE